MNKWPSILAYSQWKLMGDTRYRWACGRTCSSVVNRSRSAAIVEGLGLLLGCM